MSKSSLEEAEEASLGVEMCSNSESVLELTLSNVSNVLRESEFKVSVEEELLDSLLSDFCRVFLR